ncbi:hypothetical protein [Streptomyces lydicus]|uniref:hypothetical protein n=1 Tax=Streptomyces lydicus TaxID=47763 RepID=UPI0037B98488
MADDVLNESAAGHLITALARRPYRLRSYPELIQLARETGAPAGTAEMSVLRMCQLFARHYPEFYRDLVFNHLLQECASRCRTRQTEATLDSALEHARHRNVIPDPRSTVPEALGFLDQWLTPAERTSLPLKAQLGSFLVRSFELRPGAPADGLVLDALRRRPVFSAAAKLVDAAKSVNHHAQQTQPTFDIHTPSAGRIATLIGERWGAEAGAVAHRSIGSRRCVRRPVSGTEAVPRPW